MRGLGDNRFWPSYVDLMTSLFFVMLVLFIVSYKLYTNKLAEIEQKTEEIKVKASEAEKLEEIRKTISQLMNDSTLFIYESEFKRYRLALNIQFGPGRFTISRLDIENYDDTFQKVIDIGERLKKVLDELIIKKSEASFKNISYLLVISGRASKDSYSRNYELSYNRALALYKFWKDNQILDIDSQEYQQIIDFQISGVGVGGLGRFKDEEEYRNRGFFIQILPKISEFK